MLAADEPGAAHVLLLLCYPLHPPGKPERPRTGRFPRLKTPSLFVHGSRDTFGSLEQLREALRPIPARHALPAVEGGTHGLATKASTESIVEAFLKLVRRRSGA